MEQVVKKTQNLPKQLQLLVDGWVVQDQPSMLDHLNQPDETDPVLEKILEAIRTNGSLK
jgi:hypothetical protein